MAGSIEWRYKFILGVFAITQCKHGPEQETIETMFCVGRVSDIGSVLGSCGDRNHVNSFSTSQFRWSCSEDHKILSYHKRNDASSRCGILHLASVSGTSLSPINIRTDSKLNSGPWVCELHLPPPWLLSVLGLSCFSFSGGILFVGWDAPTISRSCRSSAG